MNNEVRETLIQLVNDYGIELGDDPRRCRALLKDFHGDCPREISVLSNALEAKINTALLDEDNREQLDITKIRLIKRLQHNYAITEAAAAWAVETWALALENKSYSKSPDTLVLPLQPETFVIENDPPPLFSNNLPAEKEQIVHNFTGSKNEIIKDVHLESGLHIFEISHDGKENFYVELHDENGDFFEILANGVGRMKISKPVGISREQIFSLHVEADGSWNIDAKRLLSGTNKLQYQFTGFGQQATVLFQGQKSKKLSVEHKGEKNFIVTLLDGNGAFIDLVVNVVGSCRLKRKLNVPNTGDYIFDVNADGKWKIKFS